jgi:hypothetical protein
VAHFTVADRIIPVHMVIANPAYGIVTGARFSS